jgi:hypothetical protein
LANDVDTAAAGVLVALGDTLAEGGVTGSRVLPQFPPGDLQARRDAVIVALRNLMGTSENGSAPDGWPRGILAHRQVSALLQTSAFSDLRGLLDESSLTAQLDALIDSANGSDIESMRARASSAELILDSLRRLILVCRNVANPDSPTLEAFRVALQQFVDPFEPAQAASGYRIPFIARPALLTGRGGGPQGPDVATTRLLTITAMRQALAENADYFLQYDYRRDIRVGLQVFVDACVQLLDRAIDLYALGTDPNGNGTAEWRAAAFGYVAHIVWSILPGDVRARNVADELQRMVSALVYWAGVPLPPAAPPRRLPPAGRRARVFAIGEELAMLLVSERAWFDLVRRMAPSFVGWSRSPVGATPIRQVVERARIMAGVPRINPNFATTVPRDVPTLLEVVI